MKHIYALLIAVILAAMPITAQEKIAIVQCTRTNEVTANTAGTTVRDINGDKCALLRVQTTERGFEFDFGSTTGAMKVDNDHAGEIWVYVPAGAKKLTIRHPELGSSQEFRFPEALKAATTYKLDITTDKLFTQTFDPTKKAQLTLMVYPPEAEVIFNGAQETMHGGRTSKTVSLGRHNVIVSAPRYHQEESVIVMADEGEEVSKTITLKPQFGWLNLENRSMLNDDNNFSQIYIDGAKVGTSNGQLIEVMAGKHALRVVKPLYETYETTIIMPEGDTLSLAPSLVKDYGEVEYRMMDPEAELYIDGQKMSTGTFQGKVGAGKRTVEVRRPYHETYSQEIFVTKDGNNKVTLRAPEPIMQTFSINTGTNATDIYVDGKKMGRTPYTGSMIIGPHQVELKGPGYLTEKFDIVLDQNQPFSKDVRLTAAVMVWFDIKPKNATTWLDNDLVSTGKLVTAGIHTLSASAEGYNSKSKEYNFQTDGETVSLHLRPILFKPNNWEVDMGGQFGSHLEGQLTLGGHYSNVAYEVGVSIFGRPDHFEKLMPNEEKNYESIGVVGSFKIGYSFRPAYFCQITPLVGVTYGGILNKTQTGDYKDYTDNVSWCSATGGLKVQIGFTRNFGIYVSPSYSLRIYGTELYKDMAECSSKMKNLAEGFNMAAGIYLQF